MFIFTEIWITFINNNARSNNYQYIIYLLMDKCEQLKSQPITFQIVWVSIALIVRNMIMPNNISIRYVIISDNRSVTI